jgi:hypothetical protein
MLSFLRARREGGGRRMEAPCRRTAPRRFRRSLPALQEGAWARSRRNFSPREAAARVAPGRGRAERSFAAVWLRLQAQRHRQGAAATPSESLWRREEGKQIANAPVAEARRPAQGRTMAHPETFNQSRSSRWAEAAPLRAPAPTVACPRAELRRFHGHAAAAAARSARRRRAANPPVDESRAARGRAGGEGRAPGYLDVSAGAGGGAPRAS